LQSKEHPNHQILKTGKCRTRDQVFEGAEIMGRALPILIQLMIDDYQRDMHRDGTAVVKGPYQKTAHKRQEKDRTGTLHCFTMQRVSWRFYAFTVRQVRPRCQSKND
jgi:hypothetical protein